MFLNISGTSAGRRRSLSGQEVFDFNVSVGAVQKVGLKVLTLGVLLINLRDLTYMCRHMVGSRVLIINL